MPRTLASFLNLAGGHKDHLAHYTTKPEPAQANRMELLAGTRTLAGMQAVPILLFVILPVAFVAYGLFDLFGDLLHLGRIFRHDRRVRDLLADGTRAPATVTSIAQTNNFMNGNPEMILGLVVMPQKGASFESALRTVIPLADLTRLQKGSSVTVAYDPREPCVLALVLDGESIR